MKNPLLFLPWFTLAAAADWLIGRTLTRSAIFMPKPPPVLILYQVLNLAGQLAATLVGLLSLGLLLWITWYEWHTRRARWLTLALLGQAGVSLIFMVVIPSGWGLVANHLAGLIAVGMIASRSFSQTNQAIGQRAALLLPALAILAGKVYQLMPALYVALHWPGPPPLTETLFNLGELLVVFSSVGLWWAYGRGAAWWGWLAAALPVLAFAVMYLANPALTGIMAIWSTGLSLYLPWPLYAASLWLAGATVIASLRRNHPAGWAILLLAAGGYAPQLSTQALLGLIALWLLGNETIRLHLTAMPWPERDTQPPQASRFIETGLT